MKIDVLIPTYRGQMHPRMRHAMERALEFSRCRCFEQSGLLASQLYEAAKKNKLKGLQLPAENPFHHPSACPHGKHDIAMVPQVDSCIIHWTRNELLRQRRPDADYYLFCDDDVVIQVDTIDRLVSHGKDIVAPLVTKRVDPPEPVLRQWKEELQNYIVILHWPNHGRLLPIDAVGTGCVLISRRVIEAMAEAYNPQLYASTGNGWWFELMRNPDGQEWGEDISFFHKARMLGFEAFCDTGLYAFHLGWYDFGPQDFLDHKEAVIAAGGLERYRQQQRDKQIAVEQKIMERATRERERPAAVRSSPDVETIDTPEPELTAR